MTSGQLGKHPLLDEIAQSLQHGPNGDLAFVPAQLDLFEKRALAIETGEELYRLVDDLISFASFLKKHGSAIAAKALITMAEPVVERLEDLAKRDKRAASLVGEAARKKLEQEKEALGVNNSSRGLKPAGAGVGLRKRR